MSRAVNDATLQKSGDIYQYLIALRDCFELNDGDILQIETNGDVSIINDLGGRFQREVKHHFGNKSISDRDIDFWKTLANWYVDYERVKNFSNYILSTTATIQIDSPFYSWNKIEKIEKLKRLKDIGAIFKENEETFRNQYNRIFGESYDESRLLEILDKFTIEAAKTKIDGISNEDSMLIEATEWLDNELLITEKYTADFSEDIRKLKETHSQIDSKIREVWKQIKTIEQKFISSKSLVSKRKKVNYAKAKIGLEFWQEFYMN